MMNALEIEFEDDTFDLVWACESGEHMPDKAKYVREMTRVLKPGGFPFATSWVDLHLLAAGTVITASPVMQSIFRSAALRTGHQC